MQWHFYFLSFVSPNAGAQVRPGGAGLGDGGGQPRSNRGKCSAIRRRRQSSFLVAGVNA